MNESYKIKEEEIPLQDSTDVCRLLTISHSDGEIKLTFINGKLYEEVRSGINQQ